jgi:hypothetical protein
VFSASALLGEVPAAALPSILIPATYAGGHREQRRWLADAGAAIVLEETELAGLASRVPELLLSPGVSKRCVSPLGCSPGQMRPGHRRRCPGGRPK